MIDWTKRGADRKLEAIGLARGKSASEKQFDCAFCSISAFVAWPSLFDSRSFLRVVLRSVRCNRFVCPFEPNRLGHGISMLCSTMDNAGRETDWTIKGCGGVLYYGSSGCTWHCLDRSGSRNPDCSAPDSSTDVRIYYHESLAQEVVASSIALLTVLCVEIFWPGQWVAQMFGVAVPTNNFESLLTVIHVLWLVINLWALAHFVSLSLRFLQLTEHERIRESYTANWVVTNDITRRLERALYLGAPASLVDGAERLMGR